MSQALGAQQLPRLREPRHAPVAVLAHREGKARRWALPGAPLPVLSLILTLLLAPALAAQSRGSLQVAARVLPVRAHQEALLAARALLGGSPQVPTLLSRRRTPLASIRSETLPAAGKGRVELVVTVSFLRN